MILAYQLTPYDGDGYYFSGKEPPGVLCDECECLIDVSYVPKRVSIRRPYDVSSTYDDRIIVSESFRLFCTKERLAGVEFVLVNERRRLYLLRIHNVLRLDAVRSNLSFGKVCPKCGQRKFAVGGPFRLQSYRRILVTEGVRRQRFELAF
jgi:hypothetical protein